MLSTPKAKAELFLASSLYDGLEDNNIMQVTTLLLNKEADPNVLIPSQGITPFHLVIGNDSETFAEEVTKLFLRHGGNPNVKSVDGMTPVHVAAAWGRLGVLELLLSNGGDPLLVDDDGRSPFHYAFDEAHYDAVACLGKYCGEAFEEDLDLKYNIALDKILVSNGGIVAEYAVTEDKFASLAGDVPTIRTSKSHNNNNELLGNFNKNQFDPSLKPENHVCQWRSNYLAANDFTITTTADESSASMQKFVNVRRHRRCLPRKDLKHVEHKLENKDKFERVKRDLPKENLPEWGNDRNNQHDISHLNDPMIEASFLVEPQKVGENMPRISSPKPGEKFVKSEHDPGIEYPGSSSSRTVPQDTPGKKNTFCKKNTSGKNKFIHKTPLRCCPKRGPLAEIKKTPTPTTAKKIYHSSGRITPNNGRIPSNDNGVLIHTPSKYISKLSSYSPDCSIVSKSPNLIGTPITPTNNYKPRVQRKIAIGGGGIPSAKDSKRIPLYGTSYKTPTPDRICNNGNSGKKSSRFVKQSDLRHQGMKKTPVSSPSIFRNSPTLSKKSMRTPNLTDSTKRKKMLPTSITQTALTPSYSTVRSPATPLNQTYSKTKYFDAAALSPDIEMNNRFVDRRALAKNIAIKLEETMYDDDCETRSRSPDFDKLKKNPRTVDAGSTINSAYSAAAERETSSMADNRSNPLNERINSDPLTFKEYYEISGVNKIGDSTKFTGSEASSSVHLPHSHNNARGSKVIAGFFQPSDVDGSSVRTRYVDAIASNGIIPLISRPYSNVLAGNCLITESPSDLMTGSTNRVRNKRDGSSDALTLAPYLKHPDSKIIDDSLLSSDPSSYSLDNHTRDPAGLLTFGDIGSSIEPRELLKNGSPGGNIVAKSELTLPGLTGESCPTNIGKTCPVFPNVSSSIDSSNYASFVSVEEEYKYEDAEEGVILLERRLLVTPISIPIIKSEDGNPSATGKSSQCLDDESMESCVSSLPHSLVIMDSETLRKELTRLDSRPPGPITTTTRHVYLKRLRKLQKHGPAPSSSTITDPPKFSAEIERTLRSESWMNDLSSYEALEQQVFCEFSNPDPTRRWREGTIKSSFNYLLMDPRITDNLPRRADVLSSIERWRIFLSSIFYVGKGRRSRPYAHLYEAYGEWKKAKGNSSDKKVDCILDIWKSNCGVVCLHLFQNTIPVEAYTREAAMIEALGLDRLKNLKSGDYYGVASTWSHHQKRTLGVYLLYKAMHILINEGERQLSPDDIGR